MQPEQKIILFLFLLFAAQPLFGQESASPKVVGQVDAGIRSKVEEQIYSEILSKAKKGDPDAMTCLGSKYYFGHLVKQNYAESAKWYRKAAEQGHPFAQYQLGRLYASLQDHAEAVKWYQRAAYRGLALAQLHLGFLYKKGYYGLRQDPAAAAKWFRRAAVQGHRGAQRQLSLCYSLGQGVVQDYVQAYMWLSLAASAATEGDYYQDYPKDLDLLADRMTERQIAEAKKLAREWKPAKSSSRFSDRLCRGGGRKDGTQPR